MKSETPGIREFINSETTFPAAIHAWEIHLINEGRTTNTVKAFLSDVQLLASYIPPDRTVGSVTTRDLNNFLSWMENERKVPCSPKTYSRRVTSIKSFYKWLKTFGVISDDPAEKVIQKSVLSPLPEILTATEYQVVLDAANEFRFGKKPDARPMALVQLLLATGIKKNETLGISPNHIDLED
ncbi:MAG TPA: phage integrase N-terminal SAM-like domain-containing protein, partial [Flexilinea sp.]|nr:phage integrase N-terminal SAM-like domain-containing protein [Flexilinea sp.]